MNIEQADKQKNKGEPMGQSRIFGKPLRIK